MKGDVAYGLAEFRRDLAEEIRLNVDSDDELRHLRTYNSIYDMCYALATRRELDDFLSAYAYDPPACEFLREIEPLMRGNVEMLGAILQRLIMDGIESGLSLEAALRAAAEHHREAVVCEMAP
ncbi:MAG TPA: hypothetical protein VJ673_02075 [Aromatoleum sp.]|uniref:hypothetical protein n=1 Tax=Aromatoleum sp. TaxID=2307007 RepID=UPI002B464733|nr:hypothetical protein [Aromatoleum sp.]HJV24437.1 hypothetical protein [Aromatoleum sp.]